MMIILSLFLASCSATVREMNPVPVSTETGETPIPIATNTQPPAVTPTTNFVLTPKLTETLIPIHMCSLFSEVSIRDLQGMVTNPFYRPAPGSDNPHQGVDFSELDPVNRYAISGKSVHALIGGKVVMVLEDQFPYGHALMVETKRSDLPEDWKTILGPSTIIEREIFHTNLTCPAGWDEPEGDRNNPSLYILYAHFDEKPGFSVGDFVPCGEEIGKIGMTGNALSPHVHVELRLGPGGVVFNSMSHYDSGATQEDMSNYCRWRVSGWYQLFDPNQFLFP